MRRLAVLEAARDFHDQLVHEFNAVIGDELAALAHPVPRLEHPLDRLPAPGAPWSISAPSETRGLLLITCGVRRGWYGRLVIAYRIDKDRP